MSALLLALVTAGLAGHPALAGQPVSGIVPRVVNGLVTPAYPAAGALLLGDDPGSAVSWCSGVLIGCRTFLTAAHCVCGYDGAICQGPAAAPPNSRIVYLQSAGFFRVADIVVHPAYQFPVADLALVTLVTPVTGIAPAPINRVPVAEGTVGTIIGFGRTAGDSNDLGLKRIGSVTVGSCGNTVPEGTSLCWHFAGTGADSCGGDSGGPLLVAGPSGTTVAGITSGGDQKSCLAGDLAVDVDVQRFADWIEAQAGEDMMLARCGGVPEVGGDASSVLAVTDALDDAEPVGVHAVDVPAGTNELRVALNGVDDGAANFDLYVKRGRPPTDTDHDCAAVGRGQYAYCAFPFPAGGPWYVLVQRASGSGMYQMIATLLGGDPPVCGNGVRETGEECDGNDDGACPGGCDARCACRYTYSGERLRIMRVGLGRSFIVKALLPNRTGVYDRLDPRHSDFVLTVSDDPRAAAFAIPADDPGWASSRPEDLFYEWRGWWARGARHVRVRVRGVEGGAWVVAVRGGV